MSHSLSDPPPLPPVVFFLFPLRFWTNGCWRTAGLLQESKAVFLGIIGIVWWSTNRNRVGQHSRSYIKAWMLRNCTMNIFTMSIKWSPFLKLKLMLCTFKTTVYKELNCYENFFFFKQSSYPTGRLNYMGWSSWPYGWASFHIGLFMSVVSSTSGRLPKENSQIQSGEHRPLGGNPAVNLTLYIWQPVAYLKNNLSWAVVSTSWNRAAGCNVSLVNSLWFVLLGESFCFTR